MKITKRGTPPAERIWRGVCSTCGTEAEATQAELLHIETDPRELFEFSWEICPVCQSSPGILFRPQPKPTSVDNEITIRSEKSSSPDHGFGDY